MIKGGFIDRLKQARAQRLVDQESGIYNLFGCLVFHNILFLIPEPEISRKGAKGAKFQDQRRRRVFHAKAQSPPSFKMFSSPTLCDLCAFA
jgi:hypothetical protein